jgi:hypothetical protein
MDHIWSHGGMKTCAFKDQEERKEETLIASMCI